MDPIDIEKEEEMVKELAKFLKGKAIEKLVADL